MKNQRGITLVSLVITIIILILLAGVSIAIVFDEDGIITKSKQAAENMEIAAIEEQEMLNELYNKLQIGSTTGGSTSNSGEFEVKFNNLKIEYENYKTKVAEALTSKGIEATKEDDADTIANSINSIQSSNFVYLGEGTSFDVSSYSGYENFTADNFIVESTSASGSGRGSGSINSGGFSSLGMQVNASCSLTVTKTYNAETGTFTCSSVVRGSGSASGTGTNTGTVSGGASANSKCKVYLYY